MQPLIACERLGRRFGGVVALDDVSLRAEAGDLIGLIGPNGAGKTTFFNLVTGLIASSSGLTRLRGEIISGLAPHRIAAKGVARTYQNIRLFDRMTAVENVLVGRHRFFHASPFDLVFRTARARREEAEARDRAHDLIAYVGLQGQANVAAANLPYGHQRRLELARALATEPTLLLLDEPMAGMTAAEKAGLAALIARLNHDGLTVLLIEHDMKVVMGLCRRVIVLRHGKLIADGPPDRVRRDPAVIDAYLGPGGVPADAQG